MRKVRNSIADKVSKNVNFLDIGLIGYKHGGGDKEVMCENFASYLDTGWHHPVVQYGILGRFIERLINLELVRKDNFPSLYAFTGDLSKMTIRDPKKGGSFTKPPDCSEFRPYPLQKIEEWYDLMVLHVKSVFPENRQQHTSDLPRTVY